MPRALAFLYTLRNKRAMGHVGGDVEANEIDAGTAARLADWVMCELIRVFHGLSLEEAQVLVDAIALRELPDIWLVGGKKRVLKKGLSFKQQTLLLLYSEPEAVAAEDLVSWTEHSNASVYRQSVLKPLHRDRLVEHDRIVISFTSRRSASRKWRRKFLDNERGRDEIRVALQKAT